MSAYKISDMPSIFIVEEKVYSDRKMFVEFNYQEYNASRRQEIKNIMTINFWFAFFFLFFLFPLFENPWKNSYFLLFVFTVIYFMVIPGLNYIRLVSIKMEKDLPSKKMWVYIHSPEPLDLSNSANLSIIDKFKYRNLKNHHVYRYESKVKIVDDKPYLHLKDEEIQIPLKFEPLQMNNKNKVDFIKSPKSLHVYFGKRKLNSRSIPSYITFNRIYFFILGVTIFTGFSAAPIFSTVLATLYGSTLLVFIIFFLDGYFGWIGSNNRKK